MQPTYAYVIRTYKLTEDIPLVLADGARIVGMLRADLGDHQKGQPGYWGVTALVELASTEPQGAVTA